LPSAGPAVRSDARPEAPQVLDGLFLAKGTSIECAPFGTPSRTWGACRALAVVADRAERAKASRPGSRVLPQGLTRSHMPNPCVSCVLADGAIGYRRTAPYERAMIPRGASKTILCGTELDFIELRGIGERVCGAFPELAWNFDNIPMDPGHATNLLLPDLAANRGDGIAEGAVRLGVPGRGSGRERHTGGQVVRPEGDEREQSEQSRGGADDREVGPLTLGFNAEMGAAFLERDLKLPPRDESLEDIDRSGAEIGAEEGLWRELAARIADQQPANGHRGQTAVVPDGGAGGDLDGTIGVAVPKSDGVVLPNGIGVVQDHPQQGEGVIGRPACELEAQRTGKSPANRASCLARRRWMAHGGFT
jgi:hypothetical protein